MLTRVSVRRRGWLKAHIACYDDGFVPSIRATGPYVHDGTRMMALVKGVGASSVRGDGAYSSRKNVQFVEDLGAVPYLKPRKNAIGGSRGYPAWRSMMIRHGREGWMEEYRKRWIVESVFSSVKRRLDPHLFSIRRDLQRKELIMKFIVHNIILVAGRR